MLTKYRLLISLFCIVISSYTTFAMDYSITRLCDVENIDIGIPTAINDSGKVVGYYRTEDSDDFNGFLWEAGSMISLVDMHGNKLVPMDINNTGTIVGTAGWYGQGNTSYPFQGNPINGFVNIAPDEAISGESLAINDKEQITGWYRSDKIYYFLYNGFNGTTTPIDIEIGSPIHAINNQNQIVGGLYNPSEPIHAFVYNTDTDVLVDLNNMVGIPEGESWDINDRKQVVGWMSEAYKPYHAFIYDPDTCYEDLGSLGYDFSRAYAINESSQVVGVTKDPQTGSFDAFLWQDGVMVSLDSLLPSDSGWDLREAYDINSSGQIVGYGKYEGKPQAFLMTPVPEPASMLLLMLGGWAISRRKRKYYSKTNA